MDWSVNEKKRNAADSAATNSASSQEKYSAPTPRHSALTQKYSAPLKRNSTTSQRHSALTQKYSAPVKRNSAQLQIHSPSSQEYRPPPKLHGRGIYPINPFPLRSATEKFSMKSRRYLGNKYKLLSFIEEIVLEKKLEMKSFCDIFAGTGVVGEKFNRRNIKIISNDILTSNVVCLKAFLQTTALMEVEKKISHLNNLNAKEENYFSKHFGGNYFSIPNAKKIGAIREEIEKIASCQAEKNLLVGSLLYAVDKVANTVGHYDAFRKKLDMVQPVFLRVPAVDYEVNEGNEIYQQDANSLVEKIACDVLYLDPPYNSRQYSDSYHLLENLAEWKKPEVVGVAKKMERSHIKSSYCTKGASLSFADLIDKANCKHVLLSYNNTGAMKDGRSNARINDDEIRQVLLKKGRVEVFEKNYPAFTAGKSDGTGHTERVFYCKVT